MRTLHTYRAAAFLVILMAGCRPALEPDTARLGLEYFPLAPGQYRIYQVEEIIYHLGGGIDTLRYQLREEVTDSSYRAGEHVFTLRRYTRPDAGSPWQPDSVWTARLNNYRAVVVENNRAFIKLSFPLAEGKRWDGNALNFLEPDEFELRNVHGEYTLDEQTFTSTVELVKEELIDPNQITGDHYHTEIFTKGVGLIHRIDLDKKYCSPIDCSQPGIILEGRVREQKILEFGVAH